ncbi:tetratricopeptide repeat protein [Halomonas dongshanensis]|uniref:Tetratricopeptide repeat protein n=1 Tax=Halomonas dongshanensis TaxID=2890835 RepID=A0ABT2EET6_9GAMM|nr:hypothetical protein [Halomonas dongshanensis]MCS2610093.1 hypothetical protein [Halomonas dongshanensis]
MRTLHKLAWTLGVALWSAGVAANQPLPGGIISDLNALEAQLGDGELDAVASRAGAQASRLAGGNAADRWASALYRQLEANALAQQEAFIPAAESLRQARQISGVDSATAQRWLREEVSLRRAGGEMDTAIELLSQWLEGRDNERDLWRLTGWLAHEQRWEEAAEWLGRATAVTSSLDDRQRSLALAIYRNADLTDEALAWLLDGLRSDSDANMWRQAAGLAQQVGRPDVAAGLWETAWQLGIFDAMDDFWTLVQLHLAGGTPARAAEHLERALAEGRLVREPMTLRKLAEAWQQAKDIDHTLAAWEALAMLTQAADDWRALGQLAYAWGRESVAESAWEKASELGDVQADQWLAGLTSEE